MQTNDERILKSFNVGKVILPVILGLGVALWLLLRNFDKAAFENINWTWFSTWWIFLAIISVCVRDLAYMIRIRILTDNHLTWRNSFNTIMLWEFASAVAPGMMGGGFIFAIFILNREKVNMGKSITAILFSSCLDGIFIAVMAPVVYFTIGKSRLFSTMLDGDSQLTVSVGNGFIYTFCIHTPSLSFFFFMTRRPPRSTRFPYPTLFRSCGCWMRLRYARLGWHRS